MVQIKDLENERDFANEVDFSVLQDPVTGDTYRISKSNLFAKPLTNKSVNTNALSLPVNGYQQAFIALSNSFILTKVVCSVSSLRVRLYLNQPFADADLNRAVGASLPTSHGLIYDAIFSGGITSLDVLPSAIAAPNGNTFLTVNNLSDSSQSLIITINYIPLI